MTTPLHSTLKRALSIGGREYVLTLTPETLKLTLKGKRNGFEVPWAKIVSGDAALAVALHASIGAFSARAAAKPVLRKEPARVGRKPGKSRRTAGREKL